MMQHSLLPAVTLPAITLPAVIFPALIFSICAVLTWAAVRHRALLAEQRAGAHLRPRSRPYAVTLPKSLRRL
jgi:hypothetical protein